MTGHSIAASSGGHMRTASLFLALALAAIGHAQTSQAIAFNIGPSGYACGINAYYCNGLPLVAGTDAGTVYGTLFYDEAGTADFVSFSGSTSFLGTAQGTGDRHTFNGVDGTGRAYVATVYLVLQPYRGCTSGRGARCSTYYRATPASSITVVYQ